MAEGSRRVSGIETSTWRRLGSFLFLLPSVYVCVNLSEEYDFLKTGYNNYLMHIFATQMYSFFYLLTMKVKQKNRLMDIHLRIFMLKRDASVGLKRWQCG